jgi:hypothetical protein
MQANQSAAAAVAEKELGKMQGANPASGVEAMAAELARVPMTAPQLKLAVPEIPGYYVQWIYGAPDRVAQAQRAGFTFVSDEEIRINNFDLAGSNHKSGNTDLGSMVSIAQPEIGADGQPIRAYLMKQRKEHREQDRQLVQQRNDGVVDALTAAYRRGTVGGQAQGETNEDMSLRYVDRTRSKIPDLFRKKPERSS